MLSLKRKSNRNMKGKSRSGGEGVGTTHQIVFV
jgi:hypothetical protein